MDQPDSWSNLQQKAEETVCTSEWGKSRNFRWAEILTQNRSKMRTGDNSASAKVHLLGIIDLSKWLA